MPHELTRPCQDLCIGPKTLQALNGADEEGFVLRYAIAKIVRYAQICNRDRSQSKFLLGWTNRVIGGLS